VVSAATALVDKLGSDVLVLDVEAILGITSHFVIGSAPNTRLVGRLVEEVEQRLKEEHALKPLRTEGLSEAHWVLLDYGDFVVHVFHEETRRFYDLERLWSDVPHWRPEEGGQAERR
jgi:ribosome-associated protein